MQERKASIKRLSSNTIFKYIYNMPPHRSELHAPLSMCMNGVPGVMTLESKPLLQISSLEQPSSGHNYRLISGGSRPSLRNSSSRRSISSSFSWRSWAARKRRERCWFIFARGATPAHDKYFIRKISSCDIYRQSPCKGAFGDEHTRTHGRDTRRVSGHAMLTSHLQNSDIHVVLCFRLRALLGVARGVDDAVHVQVQRVEFLAVRIRLRRVHGDNRITHCLSTVSTQCRLNTAHLRLILDHIDDGIGVLLAQPFVKGRDTHRGCAEI
jgi:hypothetical protein